MKRFVYFVKYWVPVFVLLGIIFWLSGANFTDGKTSEFFFPKIKSVFPALSPAGVTFVHELIRAFAHVAEYFLLGLFLALAIRRLPLQLSDLKKIVLMIVLLCLFAVGDEVRQSLVALRRASIVDVGLDLVGGVMALMIVQRSRLKSS
ncbi:MAG TPA: VanZ family protein [Smithella sp.]|nr:VanZ family protein [Smithella sp.]HNY51325.1 VanZ family protein [Smithella sp.]HOG91545.1 VanZ family protein [Smithella sp.]HOU52287.1 VanZ family protein [Smithella sp.]HQI74090.1 VanZ family protein [Smithella sp.]